MEQSLKVVSCLGALDGPVDSVLRKTYQSNWKQISRTALSDTLLRQIAASIQDTLSINDGSEEVT